MSNPKPMPRWKPAAVLIVSVCAVSTGAIFARLADAPAVVIAVYRVGLALLLLTPFTWWQSGDELRRLSRHDILLALASGLFLAAHFATWITSLEYTSVANSVVLVNTIPLWVGLMMPIVTGVGIGRTMLLCIFLSTTGSFIMCAVDFHMSSAQLGGDMLALIGALCAAFYLLLGKTLRQRLSLLAYVSLCYGSATIALAVLVLLTRTPIIGYSWATMGAMFGMALVSQIMGHTAFNWSLRWLSPGFVAVCLLGEPVLAAIWAYFLFGESLTTRQGLGAAFVLLGIYLAARADQKPRRAPSPSQM